MPLQLQSSLVDRIKEAQVSDKLQKLRDQVEIGLRTDLILHGIDLLDMVQDYVCPREMLDKNY